MSDLYAVLGVERTADANTIKREYRKRAQAAHPDKQGGNEDAFKELATAYAVLSDNSRREQYDRTGSTEEKDQSTRVLTELVTLLMSLIDRTPESQDILALARKVISDSKLQTMQQIAQTQQLIQGRLNKAARITSTGENLLKTMIETEVAKQSVALAGMEAHLVLSDSILALLATYQYTPVAQPSTSWNPL